MSERVRWGWIAGVMFVILWPSLMMVALFWRLFMPPFVTVTCRGYPPFEAVLIDDGHRAKTSDKPYFSVIVQSQKIVLRDKDCSFR